MIGNDLEDQLAYWRRGLPAETLPALERHHTNLLALVEAMQTAGFRSETVRDTLRSLVRSYEADLQSVFDIKKRPE
jgi:hypothetical protein